MLRLSQNIRRKYYGRAGAFRPKEYGHEYRVLGSALLSDSPAINQWIFNQNNRIINWLNTENAGPILENNAETIVATINASDREMARQLVSIFKIDMP